MITVTLNPDTWYRGGIPEESRLLRPLDGKMCCLGFAALDCGVSREAVYNRGYPSEIFSVDFDWAAWQFAYLFKTREFANSNQPLEVQIAQVNDFPAISHRFNDAFDAPRAVIQSLGGRFLNAPNKLHIFPESERLRLLKILFAEAGLHLRMGKRRERYFEEKSKRGIQSTSITRLNFKWPENTPVVVD